MAQTRLTKTGRKRSAADKARDAKVRAKIEQEFPPGRVVNRLADPAEPETLGDYFDLRRLVAELRKVRESSQLTLTDIQNTTGIDRSWICKLENGQNVNPTITTLARYARALGLRIELVLAKPGAEGRPKTESG